MKKLLATLAASAVAVSMFAFAGCGDKNTTPSGAIPGDYVEKTPEEMGSILDDFFKEDDSTGSEKPDDKPKTETSNIGLKINLTESMYAENIVDMKKSITADLKENINENGFVGAGTATVKANVKAMEFSSSDNPVSTVMTEKLAIDVTGTAYNDSAYIYAGATGSFGAVNEKTNKFETTELTSVKAKVNLGTLMEILESLVDTDKNNPDQSISPVAADESAGNDAFSMAALLKMAAEYGVKVSADLSDGMKVKISADESTVWTVVTKALIEDGFTEEDAATTVTTYKGFVKVNKFSFDIYLAFDSDKNLTGASIVTDIDVKVNMGLIYAFGEDGPAAVAETPDEVQFPDVAAKLSGSVELYTHSEKVSLPENIATDTTYIDMTEKIVDLIDKAK